MVCYDMTIFGLHMWSFCTRAPSGFQDELNSHYITCVLGNAHNNRVKIGKIILFSTFTFSLLADAFIQSDLQMRTMEAIKINKRAMIRKCYNKSQFA